MEKGLFSRKTILMDFDILVNTDIGFLYMVKELFPNNKFIKYNIYINEKNRIIYHLLTRLEENPLNLILKDEYKSNTDSLYKELYNKYTKKILEESVVTNIINMVITASKLDTIYLNIYCKNQLEEQYIRDKLKLMNCTVNTIIKEKITDLDPSNFDAIYVDKIYNLKDKIEIYNGKPLYITKASYNLEIDKENERIIPKYIKDKINEEFIVLIAPFIMDDSFFIDG